MVCRVAWRLDTDEREIFSADRIAVAQDHIRRVIAIVGGINRIANGPAWKIICEACALEQAERQAT
jgi:hypothetical protein